MSEINVEDVPLDTEIAPLSQSKPSVNLAPSSTQVTPSPFHNTATAPQNDLHIYERLQVCADSPLVSRKRDNDLISNAKIQDTDVLKVPPQMRSRADKHKGNLDMNGIIQKLVSSSPPGEAANSIATQVVSRMKDSGGRFLQCTN